MNKLVTIGIPIYKRLDYLPNVLSKVAAQDYQNIDLLVSDNGLNGTKVPEITKQHYSKPFRFRQNPATVGPSSHFNQLIHNALGEYVVMLADDDEITPNYVSELLQTALKHPTASAVLASEEVIDLEGKRIWKSKDSVPEVLSGEDFIRATWRTRAYGHNSLCTFLGKTEKLKACGGFPEIWLAIADEDLLMVKLALNSSIAFNTRCAFRKRFHETSLGLSVELKKDLARGIHEFLQLMDSDSIIAEYAAANPAKWKELRGYMVDNVWGVYYSRWASMYRERLPTLQWISAAFELPLSRYGRRVASTIAGAAVNATLTRFKRLSPSAYSVVRNAKSKISGTVSSDLPAKNAD
jgi:glycosyltransferase involved in cell wall biosynthesis